MVTGLCGGRRKEDRLGQQQAAAQPGRIRLGGANAGLHEGAAIVHAVK